MTNRSYLLALLLATTLSPAAPRCDGDLARLDNEAQSLLWKAQYAEALVGFRQLADCGSARAMKEIGLLYQQGKGVPRDFIQAKSWYDRRSMRASGVNRPLPPATPTPAGTPISSSAASTRRAAPAWLGILSRPSAGMTGEACAPPA